MTESASRIAVVERYGRLVNLGLVAVALVALIAVGLAHAADQHPAEYPVGTFQVVPASGNGYEYMVNTRTGQTWMRTHDYSSPWTAIQPLDMSAH